MGAIGLFAGCVWGVLNQVAKLDLRGELELDPPAPNLKDREPDLIPVFQKFMGAFYKLCPSENLEVYERRVKRAIANIEFVMLTETMMLKGELPSSTHNRNLAKTHGLIAMNALRRLPRLFKTEILEEVSQNVECAVTYVTLHLNNIHVLTK